MLKSLDDIIYAPETKSAVMSRQVIPEGAASNAVIMAKPGSPFLRRWMEQYQEFDPGDWDHMSCQVPADMWKKGEPDLTLLGLHTFMYPMQHHHDELRSFPYLAHMWLGKSWHDIDQSYGVHMWKWGMWNHWSNEVIIDPETVRLIDTPIFCRMRKLFNNVDDDGYYSIPIEQNPNCTVTWTKDLPVKNHRLFSDYQMLSDTADVKWVDSSGNNLHGFAPSGTSIQRCLNPPSFIREFDQNSFAWLPVPSDWDARVGTVRMIIQLASSAWHNEKEDTRRDEVGLFKIRLDWAGELVVSLQANASAKVANGSRACYLRFQWLTQYLSWDEYGGIDDTEWVSEKP